MTTDNFFPKTIDVNPTAKCNLDCTFCWGPYHSIPDGLTANQWKKLIEYFVCNGANSVVFTGGEPLMRKDIHEIIQHTYSLGAHITLSTNAMLLKNRASEILPYISQIGIPIDGSSPEKNKLMRGSLASFSLSLEALKLVRINYPNIEITVRTLVSRTNIDDILNIAGLLTKFADYFDRWKIYKFIPISIGAEHVEEHWTSISEFNEIIEQTETTFYQLKPKMVCHLPDKEIGRYLFVGPLGDIYSQIEATSYKTIGNFFGISEEVLRNELNQLIDFRKNSQHGT